MYIIDNQIFTSKRTGFSGIFRNPGTIMALYVSSMNNFLFVMRGNMMEIDMRQARRFSNKLKRDLVGIFLISFGILAGLLAGIGVLSDLILN